MLDPDIVLFDEPDSGLDPVRVAYLDELVVDGVTSLNFGQESGSATTTTAPPG